ncbi:PREDICTED: uncharacterized protein LOC104817702 [Tarenaya hassleriana]|uniref:uncharacterized protein LOC104817702 n=1 Tax=Tarenaya hassleriana TaxID=28532 RepID=UPI00053C7EC4|nr:PREDICTED: uncharacterized protein LOC104817702 [Tarenaya hassleriana]
MCENGRHFVEWKEHFVSQERGNRIVHYFLKDSSGESILAVVGTERSVRHMFYVVSEEFVRVHGAGNSIHAGFKWRSRREVVDWLTSMLSKQNSQGNWSKSPKCDSEESNGSPELPSNGAIVQQTHEMGRPPLSLSVHNWEIVWSGTSWICGKQLKHYPSFCRNGTLIKVQSFVFVMGKGEDRYIAYLEDMYEDKRGQRKVKVRWFHTTEEVKGAVSLKNPNPKEVFITPHSQVISAECVDGPATVLNREHYEECMASFPASLLGRVYMCFRQLRNNKVKPFDLSKLRGYFDQPIMSCLTSAPLLEADPVDHALNGEDGEHCEGEHVQTGTKRTKKKQVRRISEYRSITYESSRKKLKHGGSGEGFLSLINVGKHAWYNGMLKADAKIELMCQDSGIRGCWFRCTVLEVSRKRIKVQYDDILDEDGYGNLEEWVPALKFVMPDKLGIRSSNRPTIRPAPIDVRTSNSVPTVGTAVDAWWSDGWWEGVVTSVDNPDVENLQVYVPGESLFLTIHKRDVRISRDWVGSSWVDINPKPEILLSIVSSAVSPEAKVSMSSTLSKYAKPDEPVAVLNMFEEAKPECPSGNNLPMETSKEKKDDGDGVEDVQIQSSKEDKEISSNNSNTGGNHETDNRSE